jgi:hypothetical protein
VYTRYRYNAVVLDVVLKVQVCAFAVGQEMSWAVSASWFDLDFVEVESFEG